MGHRRLYEIKIESLEQQIKTLMKGKVEMQDEILELRDEVFDWKEKYKELRKTITYFWYKYVIRISQCHFISLRLLVLYFVFHRV